MAGSTHAGGAIMKIMALVPILAISVLAVPLAAEAQQAGKVVRVGVLTLATPTSPEVQTLYLPPRDA
jgi:hypothetical protein